MTVVSSTASPSGNFYASPGSTLKLNGLGKCVASEKNLRKFPALSYTSMVAKCIIMIQASLVSVSNVKLYFDGSSICYLSTTEFLFR